MKRKPVRVPFTALATALFLAVTFNSTPSDPAVPQPSAQPDFEEAWKLQNLAGWLAGRSPGKPLEAIRPADLEAALGSEDPGFELFPQGSPVRSAERTLLADLPFGQAIFEAAERHRVDGLLVAAVVEAESRFVPDAVSPKGARGLMQVMPGTGEGADLFDPHQNLDAGSRYLGSLIDHFDGDVELALAAYNAGPAAVVRYSGVPPYTETRRYVRRVLARYLDHRETLAQKAAAARPAGRPERRVVRARASGVAPEYTSPRAR